MATLQEIKRCWGECLIKLNDPKIKNNLNEENGKFLYSDEDFFKKVAPNFCNKLQEMGVKSYNTKSGIIYKVDYIQVEDSYWTKGFDTMVYDFITDNISDIIEIDGDEIVECNEVKLLIVEKWLWEYFGVKYDTDLPPIAELFIEMTQARLDWGFDGVAGRNVSLKRIYKYSKK